MTLNRTPLFHWHSNHGGRMVEFGGWEMPVQYSSIVEEHHAVRKAVGLFDISHMGRLLFRGRDAMPLLNHLLTCRVENLVDGQVRYGLVCNEAGGILDDVLVTRIDSETFGLVVNAGNREKIVDWINQHVADVHPPAPALRGEGRGEGILSQQSSAPSSAEGILGDGAQPAFIVQDTTRDTAMLAIQGPQALTLVNRVTRSDFSSMKYYTGQSVQIGGTPGFVSRTGYTGEDGFELVVPNSVAVRLWDAFVVVGEPLGLRPCGLGCRDTLRLEAAMPLYGHELSENIDPLLAGLGFAVKCDKSEFIGRDELARFKSLSNRPVRVGLQVGSRRIAREHSEVFIGTEQIGQVTSGTFSPTLEQSIAMAYVAAQHSSTGTSLEVDIRGKRETAMVVPLPFYKRSN